MARGKVQLRANNKIALMKYLAGARLCMCLRLGVYTDSKVPISSAYSYIGSNISKKKYYSFFYRV